MSSCPAMPTLSKVYVKARVRIIVKVTSHHKISPWTADMYYLVIDKKLGFGM